MDAWPDGAAVDDPAAEDVVDNVDDDDADGVADVARTTGAFETATAAAEATESTAVELDVDDAVVDDIL